MTETESIRQNYELGVMAGEAREQQRIIKLLEAWECGNDRCSCTDYDLSDRECDTASSLIALIKGEKLMESWAKDWDNPQDAVCDKIRSSVVSAKQQFEAPIRADERERIIKLLAEELDRLEGFINADPSNEFKRHRLLFAGQLISNQIARIKGEK